MTNVLSRKGLVIATISLFLLTGLSSVYAGSVFNEIETYEDDNIGTVETSLDKIRKVTDHSSDRAI